MDKNSLPQEWQELLSQEFEKEYFKELEKFVEQEYQTNEIFPPKESIFKAFECCKVQDVKVVIIGQDPYHGENQACGLSFAVTQTQTKLPPSLKNIIKEVTNCGYQTIIEGGDLEKWARQGVLLLNSVLTVRAHQAASHSNKGWERFTDAVVKALSEQRTGIVYMLWGSYAQRKCAVVDSNNNLILSGVHPSPLSAYRGWFGCEHFRLANEYLRVKNLGEINW